MSSRFALAPLLRIRRLQEDIAKGNLAAARGALTEVDTRRKAVRTQMEDVPQGMGDADAMRYAAFAHTATRGMLAELESLRVSASAGVDAASAEMKAAKAQAEAVGKLEERHLARTRDEDLRTEQLAIDDMAARMPKVRL